MARDCYCDVWKDRRQSLDKEGIPPGYCGRCQVCGEFGHTRHFPGAVPYTGEWCDRHYRRLLFLDPRGTVGSVLWLLLIIAAGVCIWKLVS